MKELIYLIEKSNFVVIHGNVGSGKMTLAKKLYLYFKENSLGKENVFTDEFDDDFQLARHHGQRFFLVLDEKRENFQKDLEKSTKVADLIIETCGVIKFENSQHILRLKITKGDGKIKLKIPIDVCELAGLYESMNWLRNPINAK